MNASTRLIRTSTAIAGFTFVEMLVVMSIMILLMGAGVVGYTKFNRQQTLVNTTRDVQLFLRQAQQRARAGDAPAGCTLIAYSVRLLGNNLGSTMSMHPICREASLQCNSTGLRTVIPDVNPPGISTANDIERELPSGLRFAATRLEEVVRNSATVEKYLWFGTLNAGIGDGIYCELGGSRAGWAIPLSTADGMPIVLQGSEGYSIFTIGRGGEISEMSTVWDKIYSVFQVETEETDGEVKK